MLKISETTRGGLGTECGFGYPRHTLGANINLTLPPPPTVIIIIIKHICKAPFEQLVYASVVSVIHLHSPDGSTDLSVTAMPCVCDCHSVL